MTGPALQTTAPPDGAAGRAAGLLGVFERLIEPTAPRPIGTPPGTLFGFVLHHLRPVRGLVALLFAGGLFTAALDALVPVFIGRIAGIAAGTDPHVLRREAGGQLALMAGVILVVRPAVFLSYILLLNQALSPGLPNLIRWRGHRHVVRQSLAFFQNDFAGRIATRVMQSGPAVRDVVVPLADAAWYLAVFGVSATLALAALDWWLMPPVLAWVAGYVLVLRRFVPRLGVRSRCPRRARR